MKKKNKMLLLIVSVSLIFAACSKQVDTPNNFDLETAFEKSAGTKTPRYDETIEYCKRLDSAFSTISFVDFGELPSGRKMPLLMYDKNGLFSPEAVHQSNKAVILITAAIHAGEPCGKDAGLMLLRDIALGKLGVIADSTTILFVPILSPDGHEFYREHNRINQLGPDSCGWRTNATNLNLNRDFLKAEAPETQALISLINKWKPNFAIDCHSSDGADYQYDITYMMETFGNMPRTTTEWQKNIFLPQMLKMTEADGHQPFPYVSFRNWSDPRSGLYSRVAQPRLSHGYYAIRNIPSLLIETHARKDYDTRVKSCYSMVKNSIILVNKEKAELFKFALDDYDYTEDGTKKLFATDFELLKDSNLVEFKGYKYRNEKSELTGGDWFIYSDTPMVHKIWYHHTSKANKFAVVPTHYYIPPQWTDVIKLLDIHGIEYSRLEKDTACLVNTFKVTNAKWGTAPYEGRNTVQFEYEPIENVERILVKNTVVVKPNPVVMHLLDPSAPDNLIFWGYFNAIFEQKEYAESYVMERIAREMFAKDTSLRAKFEKHCQENPDEMNSPWAKLNWLYKQTPYWDNRLYQYPIYYKK